VGGVARVGESITKSLHVDVCGVRGGLWVRPQALLILGDLVDAKTKAEGSQQHPEEWQVCVSAVC
jgi:hypothetical protein